jgi:2-polyprenyl-3-methyl-5-hydroxy-6-metoxy-1,4-benzoquinol methylase
MVDQAAQTEHPVTSHPASSVYSPLVEDADVHASSDEYAGRFAGGVGHWMLQIQESALLSMVSAHGESVLDIGGGHGQTARPLYRAGKSVTVVGSSPVCAGQLTEEIEAGCVSFKCGNLIQLPFRQRAFDLVVCFRLMSHCTAWQTLIAEMCRVADRSVIFDYPSWISSNFLTPVLFRIKRNIEGNTRQYRIFTTRELRDEFAKHGFTCTAIRKQFFFPMGLHRAMKLPRVSKFLESCANCLGLTRLFGSPVIIRFERKHRDD